MKKMWVYILECSDGSYYTGVTNNLEKRIREHSNSVHNGYTSTRLPVILKFFQEFDNPLLAIEREKQIKRWSREKKKALILGDFKKLSELSASKKRLG